MRALIWVMLVATGLWSGYWWVGATELENGVTAWIAEQSERVTAKSVEVHGIPNRFDLTVTEPVVTVPDNGISVSSPFLQVYAMTWKPWHIIAALPSGQVIKISDQTVTLGSDFLRASVQLHPSTSLALQELVGEAHALTIRSDAGWTLAVQTALASVAEDMALANSYRLGLKIENIAPDASLTLALAAADLPPSADEIYLDAHAALTVPLDRNAGQTQPKLTKLTVTVARASWGKLKFSATGTLEAAPDGFAVGVIALQLEGWKRLPPLLTALGFVTPDVAPTVDHMLGVIAAQGGHPEVLQMKLVCKDGRMSLGPLPLGPAPRFN